METDIENTKVTISVITVTVVALMMSGYLFRQVLTHFGT